MPVTLCGHVKGQSNFKTEIVQRKCTFKISIICPEPIPLPDVSWSITFVLPLVHLLFFSHLQYTLVCFYTQLMSFLKGFG